MGDTCDTTMRDPFKLSDVGVIPMEWEVKRLGELGTVVRGASPRPAGDPRYFNGDFMPWLTVAALTNLPENQLEVISTATRLTREGAAHSRTLQSGLLVIVNSGAKTLGVAKLLGLHCCANDGIAALIGQHDGDRRFLCYFLNSQTKRLREVIAAGNDQLNLNTERISKIAVPFPPMPEQRAIAEALSDVDRLLSGLERLIAKKRDLKQAALQQLLTGRKRLPGFQGRWPVKLLSDLFTFSGGYSASRDQLSTTGHCYLHYGDIHASTKTFINASSDYQDIPKLDVPLNRIASKSLLRDGDVVFVDASEDDAGASKHVVVVNKENIPFIAGLHTIVAKGKTDELAHAYRRYCFQTAAIQQQFLFYSVGTKVTGISKSNIGKLKLPVPSIPEQTAIAEVLMDMDAELAALEQRLEKTRALKQAIMQALLTGRIRLVDQATNIVAFPTQDVAPAAAAKAHNWQINEAVVIAVLAQRFGSEKFPLGRKRYTKLSYLMHRHVERIAAGYLKKAAGPYNPATKYKGPEGIALRNRYVRSHTNGQYVGFVAAEKIADAQTYFQKWYGDDVLVWLEQFRFKSNDQLELLATVDMAIEDLRRAGTAVTLGGVKQVIHDHPEWEAKLSRPIFSDTNIASAMKTCEAILGSGVTP